jgi:signal transduction protein with GAF and PtsI domain
MHDRASVIEVLRSLVDSPADLASTLHVVLGNAVRLANTDSGFIYLRDGDVHRHVSDVGATVEVVELNKANPIRPGRGTSTGRAVLERRVVHIPDVELDDEYEHREAQRLGGFRSLLSVPMFRCDDVIGVLSVFRTELLPFTDDEMDRLSMFAEQASLATVTSQLAASVERQRVEIARFLPQQVADLVSSPDGQKLLEGHRSEISVVFVDIRCFTEFSALAEPEEVISVLREYHQEMGAHVTEHEGTPESVSPPDAPRSDGSATRDGTTTRRSAPRSTSPPACATRVVQARSSPARRRSPPPTSMPRLWPTRSS